MSEAQRYAFFAGVAFALVAVAFLWRVFFSTLPETRIKRIIVVFMCAFCAGCAGGFFTGSALLDATVAMGPGSKLAFSGSAGIALFALVFLLLRKFIDDPAQSPPTPAPPPGPPKSTVTPGTKSPLSQVAERLASEVDATVDLSVLNDAERQLVPESVKLSCGTVDEASQSLTKLQHLVKPPGSIRAYKVRFNEREMRFTFVLA